MGGNMNDFRLVIGDAERVRGGRYMAAPHQDAVTLELYNMVESGIPHQNAIGPAWKLRPAVRSPVERLRRWWKKEPSGQSLRLALWLELSEPSRIDARAAHRTGARIDLCLHHSPAPTQCVLLRTVPRVVQWSFVRDDRIHLAIQTCEYPIYPGTHNFIGVYEMRWPRAVRLNERSFKVHYRLFSMEDSPADTCMIEGVYRNG
jgi:hypothetical protein